MRRTTALAAIVLGALATGDAIAQCAPGGPANPVAIRRAIVGTVMDSAHQVLENVTVGIKNPRRQAKTNPQGRFTLTDLDTGTYEVSVYRIGYETAVQSYIVTDSGGVARFCLVPEPRGLPTMVASASRLGLSGIVGDSAYQPIADAQVVAMGAGLHTLSDSAGAFYLPLKKGTYPVWVFKKGYDRQMLAVTIPSDSGRQIVVALGPAPRNANRIAAALDSMRERILWARPNRSAMVSAEQIARSSANLNGILVAQAKAPVKETCEANIDGTDFKLPLYMIDKADVLMMEIYLAGTPRNAPSSMNPGGTGGGKTLNPGARSTGPPSGNQCGTIWVWLKR